MKKYAVPVIAIGSFFIARHFGYEAEWFYAGAWLTVSAFFAAVTCCALGRLAK